MSISTPEWQPPQLPALDPTQEDLGRQHGLYPSKIPGYQQSPEEIAQQLKDAGWWQCPTQKYEHGKPCGFWLNPQAKEAIESHHGYFTCPKCHFSYDLKSELPWHGPQDAEEAFGYMEPGTSGGGTRIGIPMTDQGQIGENLIQQMKEIPGYGPIVWWHPGGAGSQSPLDGHTQEWGIEVKTLSYDDTHHRFSVGNEKGQQYKQDKDQAAAKMGLKGILGVLVMLDYRRDVADIYVKPMPLEPREYLPGRFSSGVVQFRKDSAEKLVAEVPFQSPYKDPNNPSPGPYNAMDYYQKPQPTNATPSESTPFS